MQVLTLDVLDRGVRIGCGDSAAWSLLSGTYGAMQGGRGRIDLEYTVRPGGVSGSFRIERGTPEPLVASDDGVMLALFDADLAVELQHLRRDLYFVHAAVLEYHDAAVMLVARSGGGKSTLSWALLHHGFRYLSDELGPVDLSTLDVLPYPRALMVKRMPPIPYPMTVGVRTSRGIHVPAESMPGGVRQTPAPLAAVFFLDHRPAAPTPSVGRISPAAAAARLYANALNPLSHGGDGLDAAISIATARPCFELITANLAATCSVLTGALARIP